MAIILNPNRRLSNNQYIQLYSNPVSGIAFDSTGYIDRMELPSRQRLWKIRYSKSMILKALYFWKKQCEVFINKLKRAQFNPIFSYDIWTGDGGITESIFQVLNMPDTFLFSHRHIQDKWDGVKVGYKYSKPMNIQLDILNKKYPILKNHCEQHGFQEQTMDPYYRFKTAIGIEFTVFPNEHPYIPRQKISRVGMTEKGNVFVMMDNGAHKK